MQSNDAMVLSVEAPASGSADPAVLKQIARHAHVFLGGETCRYLVDKAVRHRDADVDAFRASWNELETDTYMGDGGRYRERRHGVYSVTLDGTIARLPHRPHYQTADYNPLNGGIARHFAPITDETDANPVMRGMLRLASDTFRALSPWTEWFVEAHQFRILASDAGGKPTPEGAHRDGVSYVFMVLIDRVGLTGGETTIYDLGKNPIKTFTLMESFDAALVNDERVFHGVSTIHSTSETTTGHRDMLVLTFRPDLS